MKRSVVMASLLVLSVAAVGGVVRAWPALYPLWAAGAGFPPSLSGWQTISQPYANPLLDAEDLILDIDLAAAAPVTSSVCSWLTLVDALSCYTGTSGTAFPLVAGQGYMVQVTGSVLPYVIAGGEVPLFPIALDGPGLFSKSGTHLLSIPELAIPLVLDDASDVLGLVGPTAVKTCRFLRQSNGWDCYTGTSGIAYPLVDGEAYLVQVSGLAAFMMP